MNTRTTTLALTALATAAGAAGAGVTTESASVSGAFIPTDDLEVAQFSGNPADLQSVESH